MAFTDMDEVDQDIEEEQSPGRPSNRNFWIIFGILGGILLLALICLGVFAVIQVPKARASQTAAAELRSVQATEIAYAATQTQAAHFFTPTSRPPTSTSVPRATNTPLMAMGEASPTATSVDAAIATRSAMMTQAALTPAATTGPTSTMLPGTGFGDDLNMPELLALAAVFIVVIFLVRRLRLASPKAG